MVNRRKKVSDARVVLCDLRSAENVGAIFRTADASGISKMYLTGTTPTPIDRFGRSRRDIAKSALGAEKTVPWEYISSALHLLKKLTMDGFQVVAVEQSPEALDYKRVQVKTRVVFVFGNEVSGLSQKVLAKADTIAQIPQRGKKESLNVSVAAGIALFRILGM